LKKRLEDTDPFTEPLEGTAFEYGFNSKRLEEVVDYWKNSYLANWTERQEYLNKFTHFKTQIQGLRIHYIHVKPEAKEGLKVYPLLLLHGWPGSIREFY
jgi:juvenile hormone epoxide hydrolase